MSPWDPRVLALSHLNFHRKDVENIFGGGFGYGFTN